MSLEDAPPDPPPPDDPPGSPPDEAPITPAQIRAGRGLLKWTQGVLAARAAVSVVTLNMIEADQVSPRSRTRAAIRAALEGAGVRFVGDAQAGFGVVLTPAVPRPCAST